jgi:polysaccharide export outer membrane protein
MILCIGQGLTTPAVGQTQVRPVPPKANDASDPPVRTLRQAVQPPGVVEPASSIPAPGVNPLATTATSAPAPIGAGDLLTIAVYDTPEMTAQVRVNSNGNVTYQPIGEIHLGGLSPEEGASLITRGLVDGEFVKNPHVSIFVSEYASQATYVTGEVSRPGVYPLLGSYRLLDVLSAAGGLTERSGHEVSITHRNDPEHPSITHLNKQIPGEDTNPTMQAGDTIYVPQAGVVYVVGEVARPGGFLLDRDSTLSVVQAIALAQGTTQVAAKSKVRVVRSAEDGHKEMIYLDLKKIYDAKMPDIQLQKNDILYVPPSTVRIFTSQAFLQAASAAAAGAAVYRW